MRDASEMQRQKSHIRILPKKSILQNSDLFNIFTKEERRSCVFKTITKSGEKSWNGHDSVYRRTDESVDRRIVDRRKVEIHMPLPTSSWTVVTITVNLHVKYVINMHIIYIYIYIYIYICIYIYQPCQQVYRFLVVGYLWINYKFAILCFYVGQDQPRLY